MAAGRPSGNPGRYLCIETIDFSDRDGFHDRASVFRELATGECWEIDSLEWEPEVNVIYEFDEQLVNRMAAVAE